MNNIAQYQKVQVLTADRVRLIIMLYEGVVRFNKCAQKAIKEGDVQARNNSINRSLDILGELTSSLNMEQGGEVAKNLSRLYDFSVQQLMLANMKNESAPIEAVTKVINELKSGWEAISTQDKGQRKAVGESA